MTGRSKRLLELPATGWLRRYRVRVYGAVDHKALKALEEGIEIDGVRYGPIKAEEETRHRCQCLAQGAACARARTARCAGCCSISGSR